MVVRSPRLVLLVLTLAGMCLLTSAPASAVAENDEAR